jgi:hypothetical protein
LDDEAIIILSKSSLLNLKILDLSKNKKIGFEGIKYLSQNNTITNLKKLNLILCNLDESSFDNLSKMDLNNIEKLNLSNNILNSKGMKYFSTISFNNLIKLYFLNNNKNKDTEGIKLFSKMHLAKL